MKHISLWLKLAPVYAVIIIVAIISLLHGYFGQIAAANYAATLLSKQSKPSLNFSVYQGDNPDRIIITSVGINVQIVPAAFDYSKKIWPVSQNAAQFVTLSALPNNQSGNTFIYAHNSGSLFGPTKNIKTGDLAYLQTQNGYVFEYVYQNDELVVPTDISVLKFSGDPSLTVLTCAGSWDNQRRLLHFKLVRVI